MLSETRKRDYVLVIVWSGLLLGGLLLFVSGITHEGLWLDECFSAMAASGTLVDLWHTVIALDFHPPLYYALLHIPVALFGDSALVLRLPSAAAAVALAALGAGPIRRALGAKTGVLFTFLVLITPMTLVSAQDARMYSLAAFLVTGCAAYGYLATTGDKSGDQIKFAVFALAAAYTHYYALMAVLMIEVLILAWLWWAKRDGFARSFVLRELRELRQFATHPGCQA